MVPGADKVMAARHAGPRPAAAFDMRQAVRYDDRTLKIKFTIAFLSFATPRTSGCTVLAAAPLDT